MGLVLDRISAIYNRGCTVASERCNKYIEAENLLEDVPVLIAKIEELGFENIRLSEAEEKVWK